MPLFCLLIVFLLSVCACEEKISSNYQKIKTDKSSESKNVNIREKNGIHVFTHTHLNNDREYSYTSVTQASSHQIKQIWRILLSSQFLTAFYRNDTYI